MTPIAHPPARAEFLASALIDDGNLRDAVLGDLAEGFQARATNASVGAANRWYWSQVARSVLAVGLMSYARGGWSARFRLAFGFTAGAVAIFAIKFGAEMLRLRLLGATVSPIAVSGSGLQFGYTLYGAAPSVWMTAGFSLVAALIASIGGGYAAAVADRRTALAAAVGLVAIPSALTAIALAMDGQTISLLGFGLRVSLVLPCALAGATLRLAQRPQGMVR